MWFAAGREFPFAECSSQKLVLGRRCEGTSALSGRAGSGGMAGPRAQKAFVRPILLPHEGEPVRSGIRAPETHSKSAGPREPGAAQPRFAVWTAQGQGQKGLRCFPEPRRLRDVVCCWKRVSLCRMQLPEAGFGPSLGRGLGDVRPSWLRGHGWGLGAEALRAPNPTSPRRRTRGDWVTRAGEPQQISRAQGARGSPAPL